MKVDAISIYPIRIPRRHTFEIARGKSSHVEQVVISIMGEGLEGWGAGSPNSVTGEGLSDIVRNVQKGFELLCGKNLDRYGFDRVLSEKMHNHPAASCALSLAIWDLEGKIAGRSVAELHGLEKNELLSDMSIGICSIEDAMKQAEEAVSRGFRALKIKVGSESVDEDIKRVNAVRKGFPGVRIWVDGNRGYTPSELRRFLKGTKDANLEFIEEPCERLMDVQSLRKRFKLMADESAMDSAAIEEICKENLADMVNIKLMKCGTLSDALLSAEILENHGVSGMIGCMGETTLSIAGGLQIGFASKSILISDLDSPFMLKDDICDGLKFDDGYYRYSGRPGLGIQINLKKILQYEVEVSPSS